ncbi:hypothetical protein Tco_0553698 [Tanacetum coccineum]
MDEVCSVCCFRDGDSFAYDPNPNSFNDSLNFSNYPPQPQYQTYSGELCGNDAHYGYDCPPQVPFPLIFYDDDDDDDEESSIPLRDIISELPLSIAITPDLPITDSLIMEDEHLNTIPEMKSDKENESSVEDLVPISSESEDTSENDSDCDLPLYEDVPEDNVKIYSNPLFEFDDEYISSDVNPIFDKVLENIESKDSYVFNLNEPALFVTPLSDFNEDECFDPGGKINEIDAFLDMDISTDIENGYHDSEGDIIYLESLLINDIIPNLPPEAFLDHDPKNLKDEPDNEDLKSMVKVFDPVIHEENISPTYVSLPLEDRHYLSFTCVIQIFLPYFTYPVNSSLPLSSGIPSGESKVHIEVLSVLWGNRLSIPDGSLPLFRYRIFRKGQKQWQNGRNRARD